MEPTAAEDGMGSPSNPRKPPHPSSKSRYGGFRTLPFIIGESLQKGAAPVSCFFFFFLVIFCFPFVLWGFFSGLIAVNEAFERIASSGLTPNMIVYLIKEYNMEAADASNVLFIWSAVTNGLAIFGAFLSDAYLGRFTVTALGSFSSLIVSSVLGFLQFSVISFFSGSVCFPGK